MPGASTDQFAKFIDGQTAMTEELPLVHSTRCELFRPIATARALAPQHCPVFNEPIVYLFYGRPAYQSKHGVVPSTSIEYCPVCFVFKPHVISSEVIRVFPFDSGASKQGMFSPHVNASEADNYAMSPALLSARRVTKFFFDTNDKYWLGVPQPGLTIPPTEQEASNYYKLISANGAAVYDDRRYTVELQTNVSLSLRDTLLAVVLPTSFMQEPDIREMLVRDLRAYPITYSTPRGTIPSEYRRTVAEKLEQYLRDGGFL